jgi:hypothetical protein
MIANEVLTDEDDIVAGSLAVSALKLERENIIATNLAKRFAELVDDGVLPMAWRQSSHLCSKVIGTC